MPYPTPFVLVFVLLFACASVSPFQKETHDFWKKHQNELISHPRAPLTAAKIKHLDYFKADLAYKVTATFARFNDGTPFDMPTYSGKTQTYLKYGSLIFKLNGEEYELSLYQSQKLKDDPQYANYLFLPFKDLTNDATTYGGGRYIDVTMEDFSTGKMTLDFNHAYNPWCAYSDGYNCPIPPRENHLPIEILAGEKKFLGKK